MNKEILKSSLLGGAMLAGSIFISYYSGLVATRWASSSVTDILLDNLPFVNLGDLFVWGTMTMIGVIAVLCLFHPKWIPFIAKSSALFLVIRSFFVLMTHVGPFPRQVVVDSGILERFFLGDDYFFSGHTGLPFLYALILWEYPLFRYIGLATSVIFAAAALLGHLHYSIDVFAAYFITYSIFHMCQVFFARDYKLLRE